jgi:hypothetical protein
MESKKLLAKAEVWKRRTHRLSLDLRLRSVPEARKFIREQSVVLWNTRAEIPNLVDAIIGRIANGKERTHGRPAESCLLWREQLLQDSEFLECRLFRKQSTVLHQELWPYATYFAKANKKKAIEDHCISRDARKILAYLADEGPTNADHLRQDLKFQTTTEKRSFQKATHELQDLLIVLTKDTKDPESNRKTELLDFWENCLPKLTSAKTEHVSAKEAQLKLLSAALHGSVLTPEKNILSWFEWCSQNSAEALDKLIERKEFLRLKQGRTSWIVSRKALECANGR